jgi:hypothetical protein
MCLPHYRIDSRGSDNHFAILDDLRPWFGPTAFYAIDCKTARSARALASDAASCSTPPVAIPLVCPLAFAVRGCRGVESCNSREPRGAPI